MFKMLSIKEQLQMERENRLAKTVKQDEFEQLALVCLLDLDFRQSLTEMGVDINDL